MNPISTDVPTLTVVALLVFAGALLFLGRAIKMFKDDVTTALVKQATAIDNLTARLPQPVDPETIVPVTDQQQIVSGIDAQTARIDALAPVPPTS